MHTAASSLAAAVGYDSAGTVEFLVDETNASGVSFYFLEMNTRLQVEHTVTEEIYGIDLVEWQIRVARGEALPPEFSTLKPRGHSIEVRIYAEDPGNNFFPAPGSVRAFVPPSGRGIRWELGIDLVDEISDKFDPMIAKLVCSAGDRRQALELVAETLERTLFAGPRNNIQFLCWLVRHPKITSRPVDTHFIGKNVNHALDGETNKRAEFEPMVNSLLNRLESGSFAGFDASTTSTSHTTIPVVTESSFSLGNTHAPPTRQITPEEIQIISAQVAWSPKDPRASSRYGFGRRIVHGQSDLPFSFVVYKAPNRFEYWIGVSGHNWVRIDEQKTIASSGVSDGNLDGMTAPVPGKVIQVAIGSGDIISKGQTLFVLESMKMQFEVKASLDGRAGTILVNTGQQVSAGQQLAHWASEQ
jgi:acetyl/propionyl-CoA carboxylase alpha subunit